MSEQTRFKFEGHALEVIAANEAKLKPSSFKERKASHALYRSHAWLKKRAECLARDGPRCCKCGATRNEARIDVDHIKPFHDDPHLGLMLSNLQVLCEDCHEAKTYTDRLRRRQRLRDERKSA